MGTKKPEPNAVKPKCEPTSQDRAAIRRLVALRAASPPRPKGIAMISPDLATCGYRSTMRRVARLIFPHEIERNQRINSACNANYPCTQPAI
jgi:hypothetical protein